jgi:hypothetical protein
MVDGLLAAAWTRRRCSHPIQPSSSEEPVASRRVTMPVSVITNCPVTTDRLMIVFQHKLPAINDSLSPMIDRRQVPARLYALIVIDKGLVGDWHQ